MANFITKLNSIYSNDKILIDEPMKNHTTFKVGGVAKAFLLVESFAQLKNTINILKEENTPYFIIGKGSNLLFSDNGYDGVILSLSLGEFSEISLIDSKKIQAGCGVSLSKIANFALENSLSGFEFASGIPGTFGGAIFMNAGAYGGEIKDVFVECDVLDSDGNIFTLSSENMDFSYRTSVIQKNNFIVLRGTIELNTSKISQEIKDEMLRLNRQRAEKQPIDLPSCGSTFKRPDGYFAAKLINDSGLKGFSIGGAMVSEKHTGFIVNYNNATAENILDLIKHVQKTVFEKFGVMLETEVKII